MIARLEREPPPLARIDADRNATLLSASCPPNFASPRASAAIAHTADRARRRDLCRPAPQRSSIRSSGAIRYPFTNCTHCGPRLSIVDGIPYDRADTTMAPFRDVRGLPRRIRDPADRRFHAEAIACHACGPTARLVRFDGRPVGFDQHSMLDDVDAACGLMQNGRDRRHQGARRLSARLRCHQRGSGRAVCAQLKQRDAKPFALMARDLDVIRRYCSVERRRGALCSQGPAAPIVLLRADGVEKLPEAIAPGLATLGFMLPTTPLHLLMLRRMERPVVMTSGNLSDEPQVIDDDEARERLGGIATYALDARPRDRQPGRRFGGARDGRASRGCCGARAAYAPAPIALPEGLRGRARAAGDGRRAEGDVLPGQGRRRRSCRSIRAISRMPRRSTTTASNLALYAELFDHAPVALVADRHPEYLSSKLARALGARPSRCR